MTGASQSTYVIVKGSFGKMTRAAVNDIRPSVSQRTSTLGQHEWFSNEGAAYNAVPEAVPETADVIAASRVSAKELLLLEEACPWPWS